jgi:hypothetical protein
MQQYIFRGLTEDNKWVYGSLIQRVDGIGKLSLIEVQDKDGEITVHQVKPETVGQFTGWTDKHSNNIFAGDTLRGMMGEQQRDRSHYDPIVSAVELRRGGFEVFSRPMSSAVMGAFYWNNPAGLINPAQYWTIDEWEVIGNIYDVNPASGTAGDNYMLDPKEQAAEGQEQAVESAAQDNAMEVTESAEEGGTEG